MTQRAQQMGMTNSTFTNASGWPQAGHLMSMRDLALLADRLQPAAAEVVAEAEADLVAEVEKILAQYEG